MTKEQPDLVAEIERLKAMIPKGTKRDNACETKEDWQLKAQYYESGWAGCSHDFNKVAGELRQQLSAAQASEAELLKALELIIDDCITCDNTEQIVRKAIAAHKARKEQA